MKGRNPVVLSVIFLLLFISHLSFAETSTKDYSRFKSPQHVAFAGGVWSYGFDVAVNIGVNGKSIVSIGNIKPKQEGAWANLSA